MKKEGYEYFNKVRKIIKDEEYLERSRISQEYFTRNRKMPFSSLILFMINLVKKTLQKELTDFMSMFSSEKNITKSAFCQSRMKLKPEAFVELNDSIIEEFYTDNDPKKWKDFILLGVDASTLNLPESKELNEKYGKKINQHDVILPQALISSCYDLLNEMILNSEINSVENSEYFLALKHFDKIRNLREDKKLLLFDRGYGAIWFMFCLLKEKHDFVIRLQRNFNSEISDFFDSEEKERIFHVKRCPSKSEEQLKKLGIEFKEFKIRLVKVILDNGEVEVLATSLIDDKKYPPEIFKELYFKRWGIEIQFDHLKNNISVENFTGISEIVIKQDFFANMFILNMQNIIVLDAQEELKKKNTNIKYEYKINKNLSLGFLKDNFVRILWDKKKDNRKGYNELKNLFLMNPCPIRKGRKFPRSFTNKRRKWYMCKKKAV